MNIVYPPTLDFDFMRQRPQQLMLQFARHGHRVFFINKTRHRGRRPQEVAPNLWVVHDPGSFVRKTVPRIAPTLVWCSWGRMHDRLGAYRPSMVVFDCVDDFPEWRRYEDAMLRQANAVVVTARVLHERVSTRHPRVALVPNGCDYEFFSTPPGGPPPRDLPPAPGPRAGFVGALGSWVDGSLITRAATALPGWQIVLVGPQFGAPPISAPNILHLGLRPYEDLPRYLHRVDVALIPFVDNHVTRATNPIKLWEYLAAGLPVVSTPLPEILPHRDVVRVASGDGFAREIQLALGDRDHPGPRQALAKANSWEARYRAIADFIPQLG